VRERGLLVTGLDEIVAESGKGSFLQRQRGGVASRRGSVETRRGAKGGRDRFA